MPFDKTAYVYFIWKIYYNFSTGNGQPREQQCANCIGTLLFPLCLLCQHELHCELADKPCHILCAQADHWFYWNNFLKITKLHAVHAYSNRQISWLGAVWLEAMNIHEAAVCRQVVSCGRAPCQSSLEMSRSQSNRQHIVWTNVSSLWQIRIGEWNSTSRLSYGHADQWR